MFPNISISSSENFLFRSITHFLIELFVFSCLVLWFFFIYSRYCHRYSWQRGFSHSVSCLFPRLAISSLYIIFLVSWSHVSSGGFISGVTRVWFRKSIPKTVSWCILPTSPLKILENRVIWWDPWKNWSQILWITNGKDIVSCSAHWNLGSPYHLL